MLPFYLALVLAVVYLVLGLKKPGVALVTMPAACGVFVSVIFLHDDPGTTFQVFLAVPIILITTLSAILLSRPEPDLRRWPHIWAKWLLLGFAFVLFWVTFFCVTIELPPLGFPLLLIFVGVIGLAGAGINYGLTSGHAVAAYVLSTIGSSMRQNLPLPMALESAVSGRSDKRAIILRRIVRARRWR